MAGMKETLKVAEQGMALFNKEASAALEFDVDAATAYREQHEAAMKAKEDLVTTLTGKDNKKQRTEVSKEVASMKAEEKYVDACKVVKGLPPPKGNFVKGGGAQIKKVETGGYAEQVAPVAKAEEKTEKDKDKKPSKRESAGISKAERDELEKLKGDIIKRKAELKSQGMSGGQCNKDEQVVSWVARMQELKIKEDPSLPEGDNKKDDKKAAKKAGSLEKVALEKQIEEYRVQLKQEFGYTDKDIKADPDMLDMQKQLSKMK